MSDSMPAAITFDFHNTIAHCDRWFILETKTLIADWLTWYGHRHRRTFSPSELAAASADFRQLREEIKGHGREMTAAQSVAAIAPRFAVPADPEEIERGIDQLMRGALADLQPVAGAIATVRQLAAANYPLGIVSSAIYHPFLVWALEQFEIAEAFAVVTTSASIGFYKSRPEIYRETLAALGADPAASVHVGDSYRFDVEGAHRAGMRAAWLQTNGSAPAGDGRPPELVLPSLVGAAEPLMALLGPPRSTAQPIA